MATNSEIADSWSQKITLTLISTSQVTYDDLDLDASCTVQVSRAIASVEDVVLPIHDSYEIDIGLSLAPSTPIKLYRVTLRALEDEVPTEGPEPWSDAIIDRGSDRGSSPIGEVGELTSIDEQPLTIWSGSASGSYARTTLSNSSWSQTLATIHGISISVTSDANSNVSGSGGIKGRDDCYMPPHTQAFHMSPIKIENRTSSEVLDVIFEVGDTEDETEVFAPQITGVLQIDDDGEGLQTGDTTAAGQLNFELAIWAIPERFISIGGTDPVKIVRTFSTSRLARASTPL